MNQTTPDLDRLRQMNTKPDFQIITARPAGMKLSDYRDHLRRQKTHIKNRINKPFWWAKGVKAPGHGVEMDGRLHFRYLIQPMGTYTRQSVQA